MMKTNNTPPAPKTAMERKWERQLFSWMIVGMCVLLGMWGCMSIYSTQIASRKDWYFLGRQICFLVAGVPLMLWVWKVKFKTILKWSVPLGLTALFAVIGVLFWGKQINGMAGWFEPLPNFRIQPSELAKPFYLLLLLSAYKMLQVRGKWQSSGIVFAVGLTFTMAVALEPDFGTASIFLLGMLIFIFISGESAWRIMVWIILLSAAAAPLAWWRWNMVVSRFSGVFNPSEDSLGAGWHVQQFQLAIARGGWTGSKLGNTVWTENYLPLAHNDSIFAAISETLGFLGTLPLIFLLSALVVLLIKLALNTPEHCRRIYIASTAFMIGVQALLHISVNVTLLPPSGLTLPLISYGGSSLIGILLMVGLALSAARPDEENNS